MIKINFTTKEIEDRKKAIKRESNRRYRDKNRAKTREYKAKWRKANREHIRAYDKNWRANNPDKVKEYRDRHYTKRAIESLSIEQAKKIGGYNG